MYNGKYTELLLPISHSEAYYMKIQNMLDSISENSIGLSFSNGLTGASWFMTYVLKREHAVEELEILKEFDPIIENYVSDELIVGNYDFLHNGLGGVLYFIERNNEEIINQTR